MATEYKLSYTASEINRKLATVDETANTLENDYYTSADIDTKIKEVNSSLTAKADLVDGKIPVEQIPDGIGGSGGLTEVAWEDIQNKPFYVIGYKAEWNGKKSEVSFDDLVDTLGITMHKIGEPISKEALIGSTAVVCAEGTEMSVVISQELIVDMTEAGGYLIMDTSSGAVFGSVSFVENDVFDLSMFVPGLSFSVPYAGLWAIHDGTKYLKSVTAPDYDCKQLDPRVIPANLDFDLSDYYTKEEMDAITGDIETVLNEITVLIGE